MKRAEMHKRNAEWVSLYENGVTSNRIAADFGCHVDTVLYHLRKLTTLRSCEESARQRWREDPDRESLPECFTSRGRLIPAGDIVRLHQQGRKPKQIASDLGCHVNLVYLRLKQHRKLCLSVMSEATEGE